MELQIDKWRCSQASCTFEKYQLSWNCRWTDCSFDKCSITWIILDGYCVWDFKCHVPCLPGNMVDSKKKRLQQGCCIYDCIINFLPPGKLKFMGFIWILNFPRISQDCPLPSATLSPSHIGGYHIRLFLYLSLNHIKFKVQNKKNNNIKVENKNNNSSPLDQHMMCWSFVQIIIIIIHCLSFQVIELILLLMK